MATPADKEMLARIAEHQRRRPPTWVLVEEPLTRVLREQAAPDRCLPVDCPRSINEPAVRRCRRVYYGASRAVELPQLPGHIILVSNETGMGVVPLGALSRRFCDEAGWLHQDIAQLSDRVILTVAGLPHLLKGKPTT